MGKFLRILLFLVLAGFLVSTNVYAYPVEVGDTIFFDPGFRATRGGEFRVYDLPDGNSARKYLFSSFCLERNEYLNFSAAFHVAGISDSAQNGGISGATNDKDPIADSTAWLFWQFSKGNLDDAVSGWNYGDNSYAASLQNAIWSIEGEGTEGGYLYQYLIDAADAAVSAGWTNDDGKVAVLNLKYADGRNAQDQLVAAVPEPSTMLLLGLGLIGLAGFGRKKIKGS